MGMWLRTWRQKVKKPLEIIGVTIALVLILGLVVLIVAGYIFKWTWTGFGPEASTPQQHAKTLWDWLQLLIIPFVLAVGGYMFNLTVSRNEQQNTRVRDQTEREISLDNQQEAALQAYIDNMSELLLHEKLRDSASEDEVRKIARVRTLTVLPRLNPERKGSVLQFLHESGLIEKDKTIVNLNGANLSNISLYFGNFSFSGTNLNHVNLTNANLYGVDFSYANLSDADLSRSSFSHAKFSYANLSGAFLNDAKFSYANLSNVNFSDADLEGADLLGADLSGASVNQEQLDEATSLQEVTMPDGTTHS